MKFTEATDSVSPVIYLRLVEITDRCPPEDCGGPWGYAELLDAIKDPMYERYAELTEWIGVDFDPDAVDPEWLTAEVASLAKKMVTQADSQASPPRLTYRGLHRTFTKGRSSGGGAQAARIKFSKYVSILITAADGAGRVGGQAAR